MNKAVFSVVCRDVGKLTLPAALKGLQLEPRQDLHHLRDARLLRTRTHRIQRTHSRSGLVDAGHPHLRADVRPSRAQHDRSIFRSSAIDCVSQDTRHSSRRRQCRSMPRPACNKSYSNACAPKVFHYRVFVHQGQGNRSGIQLPSHAVL